MPKNSEHFIFPIAHGTVKLFGRDQEDNPSRDEGHRDDLQGVSDGSQPLDTMTEDSEARNDFGRW